MRRYRAALGQVLNAPLCFQLSTKGWTCQSESVGSSDITCNDMILHSIGTPSLRFARHTCRPTSLGLAPLGLSPRARDPSRSTHILTSSSTSRSLCLYVFLFRRSRSGLAYLKSHMAEPVGHQQQFGNSLDGTRPSALTLEFLRVSQLICHSAFMLAYEVELYSVTNLGMCACLPRLPLFATYSPYSHVTF